MTKLSAHPSANVGRMHKYYTDPRQRTLEWDFNLRQSAESDLRETVELLHMLISFLWVLCKLFM